MKQLHFYASKDDLLAILDHVEQEVALNYVPCEHFLTPSYECFARGAEIPNLSETSTGSTISSQTYLVVMRDTPVSLRPIATIDGVRFSVDQMNNPDSIVFTPGGIWGENVVISGRVATVSESGPAQLLMKKFNSAFKKQFSKIKAFFVGPQALRLLNEGKRLTQSAQSPLEYDLKK